MISRIVFLDYDGVVNTPMWNEQGTHCSYGFPGDGKVNNFQAVQWLSEACQKFHFDIVVTSTWRLDENYKECLINAGLRHGIEIRGKTPRLKDKTRGDEIQHYIDAHPEIEYYIIVDDEDDLLPNQMNNFIQTDGDVGFALKDFRRFEEIFQRDATHGGTFPDKEL